MSTILLPAVRRDTANLVRYDAAGRVQSGTGQFVNWTPNTSDMVKIADMGLAVGDVVSASAELKNDVPGESCTMSISGRNSAGTHISAKTSSPVDSQAYTRHVVENYTIPAGTVYLLLYSERPTGTGAHYIRNGMINRGPTAQPYDIPKRGADAPWLEAVFEHDEGAAEMMFYSGASQTTSGFRTWFARIALPMLAGDELREWSHAMHKLKKAGNVFHFVHPEYDGPSTGYEGANPVVNGASQTGTSLVCDGVDASTDIVGPGDFASFEVTSAGGEKNVELHRIASLCTSDASGNVTLKFEDPIRQAPADNATVQIYAPYAQFRLAQYRSGVRLDSNKVSSFVLDAIEKRFL